MEESNLLTFYCQNNNTRGLVNLLKQHSDLDLTTEEGICFFFAIKHNNIEMLNNLLDYYKDIKLQGDCNSMEYKVANYTIKKILQESVDSLNQVSPEILEILAPYITTAEDSDDELYLSDFDDYDATEQKENDIGIDIPLGYWREELIAALDQGNIAHIREITIQYKKQHAAPMKVAEDEYLLGSVYTAITSEHDYDTQDLLNLLGNVYDDVSEIFG